MKGDPKYHLLVNVLGTTVPFVNTEMRLVDFQTWTNTILYTFFMSTWRRNLQGVENNWQLSSRAKDHPSLEINQSHSHKANSGSVQS